MTQAVSFSVTEMPGDTEVPSGGALHAWLDNATTFPLVPPLETRIVRSMCGGDSSWQACLRRNLPLSDHSTPCSSTAPERRAKPCSWRRGQCRVEGKCLLEEEIGRFW